MPNMEKVFLNDNLVDTDKARVSAGDSGFLYGAGLFETMRSYAGTVFRLGDHLDRLLSSANALSIEHSYERQFLTEAVYKVLEANGLSDARIRLTLSAGAISQAGDKPKPTLLISAAKLKAYPAEYYGRGVLVVLCPFRQNVTDPTCGHKTTSYFPRMLALRQAHEKRAAEALWFTTDGRLAEGCISNVFLVKDSTVLTPAANTPVLAGIARKTVCEIALSNSMNLTEKDLSIDDLLGADEIFLTNVIMQIMPVCAVEKHTVGDGKPGAMTKKIRRHYQKSILDECKSK